MTLLWGLYACGAAFALCQAMQECHTDPEFYGLPPVLRNRLVMVLAFLALVWPVTLIMILAGDPEDSSHP